jgi:hypothetical protein
MQGGSEFGQVLHASCLPSRVEAERVEQDSVPSGGSRAKVVGGVAIAD